MKHSLVAAALFFTALEAKAQVYTTSSGAVKLGIGVGYNDTNQEQGLGILSSIGYQKSFGPKSKLRINPNLLLGSFSSKGINDARDQYYQMSALQFVLAYDVIRFKSISLFASTGGSLTYSRGLFGTGGEIETPGAASSYFNNVYLGVLGGVGFRINKQNNRVAYEIKPLNFALGNNGFSLANPMLSIDYKLKK